MIGSTLLRVRQMSHAQFFNSGQEFLVMLSSKQSHGGFACCCCSFTRDQHEQDGGEEAVVQLCDGTMGGGLGDMSNWIVCH